MNTNGFKVVSFSTIRVLCAVVLIVVAAFFCIEFAFHRGDSKAYAQGKACINNLRAIDAVKHQWAIDLKKQAGDAIASNVIEEYFARQHNAKLPRCPADGTYSYGETVGAAPTCSFPGHKLSK